MIGRSLLLAGLFAVFGVGAILRPRSEANHIDETWLERTYPSAVDGYSMVPAADGSKGHSYKMDETTYQALQAYGIVGRTLTDGRSSYDVVVIAGDQPDTFHNPVACFGSQEWKVLSSESIKLATKTHGEMNATVTKAEKGGQQFTALYTFEGPDSTYGSNADLINDLFWSQLKSGKVQTATFFRFMASTPSGDDAALRTFAVDYLDHSPVRPIARA